MKHIFCHLGILLALGFNMWISFRVLDDWYGLVVAITGMLLFPLTVIVLPIAMFFIPSSAAGPFALWPGMVVISILYGVNRRMQHN